MVKAVFRLTLAAGFALCVVAAHGAKEPPDYRIGETVAEDIVTPVPLTVVDDEATSELRQKEAARVLVIFRYYPAAADEAESELRAAFANTRSNFLRAVERSFRRRKLDDADLVSTNYERLLASFLRQTKSFPVSTNLAELWARGDSGRVVQATVLTRLLEAMEHPIRAGALPPELKVGSRVRFVTVTNRDEALTLAAAQQRGVIVQRSNTLALLRVRTELRDRFPVEERAVGSFTASLVRPNCFLDAELTQQARAQTDALLSADNYAAGQVIARAGQVVDRKVLAALEQLREKTAPVRLQEQITVEQTRAAQIRRRNQWLAAGLVLVTATLAVVAWRLVRRRRPVSLLPAKIAGDAAGAVISCPSCDQSIIVGADAGSWQQRALTAEQSAERARAAIRAGVLAQLAGLFREKLVHGLVSQRGQLLDAQKSAAAEMAELERRLNELHAPLQERLRAYEKRIAELEKALSVKGEENRELIKAKIQLTRRQLESERARNRMVLN